MKSAQIRKRPNLKNRGLVRVARRFAGEIRKSCFPRTRTGIHCSAQGTQVRAMPPRSVQNPSKPVTDPTHKTPRQGTPGLAMHRPDTAVESDRLSGQARRGLDCARRVWMGYRAPPAGRPCPARVPLGCAMAVQARAAWHRPRVGGVFIGARVVGRFNRSPVMRFHGRTGLPR